MEHVELLRVHTSGTDLVLRTPAGEEYLLALDDTLKRSVRMPTPRTSTAQATEANATLSPRQIQARIRAGQTALQVAEDSGTELDHVLRYEGPVMAERDYIARRAQEVEVSSPLGHEGYRAAFGDEPATLGEMVRTRLRAFGVKTSTLTWDAWKLDAGTWRIVADFEVPQGLSDLDEEPPAKWTFHPGRRHLQNANRWGQVLSEWEPWDVLPSQRRLVPVSNGAPFDVEETDEHRRTADTGDAAETAPSAASAASAPSSASAAPASSAGSPEEPERDLLEVLARRRGTRTGEDAEQDEALARMLSRSRTEPGTERGGENRTDGLEEPQEPEGDWPPLRSVPDPIPAVADDSSHTPKKRRSQVPSWDEIVFGRSAKGDDEED